MTRSTNPSLKSYIKSDVSNFILLLTGGPCAPLCPCGPLAPGCPESPGAPGIPGAPTSVPGFPFSSINKKQF